MDADKQETKLERLRKAEILSNITNFSIGKLNLLEAAELIVCDLWNDGEIIIKEIRQDLELKAHDHEVRAALSDTISIFVNRLINAIEFGRLKPENLIRDFDERIIPEHTFVDGEALGDWLLERGRDPGDIYWEWRATEERIAGHICGEILWLRSSDASPFASYLYGVRHQKLHPEIRDKEQRESALKSAHLEIEQLRRRLAEAELSYNPKLDDQAPPKARRTLLTLIAALCLKCNIKISSRGAAQRLMGMTQTLGNPIDDETIRQVLALIPEALE